MKHIFALLFVSVILMPACTASKWVRTPVAKDYDFAVAVEQQPGSETSATQKQERAKRVELADLKRLMTDLSYVEKGGLLTKSAQAPVFQADEMNRLAPVLVDALAKSDPTQRVRFLSFNQGQGVIFSNSRKTEGVVFWGADGQLNVAFNYVNANRLPSETSAIYVNFSDVDPLSIRSADSELAAKVPYLQSHRFENGKTAPLWIVADLAQLAATPPAAPTPPVAPAPTAVEVTPAVKAPGETSPAVAPVAAPLVMPAEKTTATPDGEASLRSEIKNKLKYLKELFEEGLISEKDYQVKKQDLLDKID